MLVEVKPARKAREKGKKPARKAREKGNVVRVAIINVCETGHRVLDAVRPAVVEFFEKLGAKAEIVAEGNLWIGVVDLSDLVGTLEETVKRADAALVSALEADADAVVVVLTGPYLIAFAALERIRRSVGHKVILIAQFDMASRKYVFIEDRRLFEILHTPFRGGVK